MRRTALLVLALLVGVAACSGRSSIGAKDDTSAGGDMGRTGAGEGGADAGLAEAGADSASEGGSYILPAGGEGPNGPLGVGGFEEVDSTPGIMVGPGCNALSRARAPATLAAPAVVWARISRYVFGDERAPLTPLPESTTEEWASATALAGFDAAQELPGGAPGVRRFLGTWLGVDAASIYEQDWPALLDGSVDATRVLLLTRFLEPARVGIFSEVAFLASHPSISSRGAAMATALRIESFPPPPLDHPVGPVVPEPGQTRRAALELQMARPDCQGCHNVVDAMGYSLEHFDVLGQYQDFDAGEPVDSSGSVPDLVDQYGEPLTFTSIESLMYQLAALCEPALALVQWHYADALLAARITPGLQQVPGGYEDDQGYVALRFMLGGKTYRSLVKAVAQSRAFLEAAEATNPTEP